MAATAAIMYSLAEHFHCIDDTSIVIAFTHRLVFEDKSR